MGNVETNCRIEDSINDLLMFCKNNPDNCQSANILQNFTSNMFVLIGKLTEVSEIMKNFPEENAEDLYLQTYTIGNDFGTSFRVISGFQPLK